jgi:hypothetical protein
MFGSASIRALPFFSQFCTAPAGEAAPGGLVVSHPVSGIPALGSIAVRHNDQVGGAERGVPRVGCANRANPRPRWAVMEMLRQTTPRRLVRAKSVGRMPMTSTTTHSLAVTPWCERPSADRRSMLNSKVCSIGNLTPAPNPTYTPALVTHAAILSTRDATTDGRAFFAASSLMTRSSRDARSMRSATR